MIAKILKIPKWDDLNRLGKSRLLQSSYVWLLLVPMAAKALSAIENPLILTGISDGLRIHIALPFSWHVFYFSAVFVSIAGVIYTLFCPKLIRSFGNYAKYRSEGRGQEYLLGYSQTEMHQGNTLEDGWDNAVLTLEVKDTKNESEYAALFWKIHTEENKKSPIWRLACFSLYAVGLVLVLIVLTQNFIFVVSALAHVAA